MSVGAGICSAACASSACRVARTSCTRRRRAPARAREERRGDRCADAILRRRIVVHERLQERFATRAHEHGCVRGAHDFGEPPEELAAVTRVLRKPETRIHHEILHARFANARRGFAPLAEHVDDDVAVCVVGIRREVHHLFLRAARVHQEVSGVAARGDLRELRFARAGHVVHGARARVDARIGDVRARRVDGDRNALRRIPHDLEHAIELVLRRDARRAGPRRLTADVDHVGALRDERIHVRARVAKREVLAAVRERIGRHVAHAEQKNAASFDGLFERARKRPRRAHYVLA